jgi:hypothetical protein
MRKYYKQFAKTYQMIKLLAGKIWVWGSLIMLVLVFLMQSDLVKILFWVYLAVIVSWPIVFSWTEYRKNSNK